MQLCKRRSLVHEPCHKKNEQEFLLSNANLKIKNTDLKTQVARLDTKLKNSDAALDTLSPNFPSAVLTFLETGNTRGGGDENKEVTGLSPDRTVVLEQKPTFTWASVPEAIRYELTIPAVNITARNIQGTSWTPGEPLPRGQNYTWEIKAFDSKNRCCRASITTFVVVEERLAREIERLRRQKPVHHLALGSLYAQACLLDEAKKEFEASLREDPQQNVARKFLHEVQEKQKSLKRPD